MSVKVSMSATIMAHPGRAEAADEIASKLTEIPVRVVFDPDPTGPRSTVRTARDAWVPWVNGATHHLVLQDDITLLPEFESRLEAAVSAQPQSLLSLFSEWGSFNAHATRVGVFAGTPWVEPANMYIPTNAAIAPVAVAEDFAQYLRGIPLDVPDDEALYSFAARSGIRCLIAIPNLIQHDSGALSLSGNISHGLRRASVVDRTVLKSDYWESPPLASLVSVPGIDWRTGLEVLRYRDSTKSPHWRVRKPSEACIVLYPDVSALLVKAQAQLVRTSVESREIGAALCDASSALVKQFLTGFSHRLDGSSLISREQTQMAIATFVPGSMRIRLPALTRTILRETEIILLQLIADVEKIMECPNGVSFGSKRASGSRSTN